MLRSFTLVVFLFVQASPSYGQAAATAESSVGYDADLPSPEFHRGRRAAVIDKLPAGAAAVIFSSPVRNRDNDVDYEYRQASDLYYLTGMTEPGTVLILVPDGVDVGDKIAKEVLFVPPRDPARESWEGRRLGPERAASVLGIEVVKSNEEFADFVDYLAANEKVRFFHLTLPADVDPSTSLGQQIDKFVTVANPLQVRARGRMASMAARYMFMIDDQDQFERMKRFSGRLSVDDFETPILRDAFEAFGSSAEVGQWIAWRKKNIDEKYADGRSLDAILAELRSVKTPEEIRLMQRAIDVTVAAQREAMRSIEPGMHEYEIEAVIEYVFRRNGSEYPGFPSIVGSGENSTILHYGDNRRQMGAGDLVVMDIGAEYHGYSADVTRTVPVDGTFSAEQRAIYELVLRAQDAGIQAARAGDGFGAPHEAATRVITDGLIELGLITEPGEVRRFFTHGTSHYLGLSVHDVGTGGPLMPGMVITVEPGIYIRPAEDVERRWWNIGVRIEDDILVTEDGPVNMSAGAPKSVTDIEALMRETGLGNDKRGVLSDTASS